MRVQWNVRWNARQGGIAVELKATRAFSGRENAKTRLHFSSMNSSCSTSTFGLLLDLYDSFLQTRISRSRQRNCPWPKPGQSAFVKEGRVLGRGPSPPSGADHGGDSQRSHNPHNRPNQLPVLAGINSMKFAMSHYAIFCARSLGGTGTLSECQHMTHNNTGDVDQFVEGGCNGTPLFTT